MGPYFSTTHSQTQEFKAPLILKCNDCDYNSCGYKNGLMGNSENF